MRQDEIRNRGRENRVLHDALAQQGVLPPALADELLAIEEAAETNVIALWAVRQRRAIGG